MLFRSTAVGRFLERKGPGLHHVAYAVDDIDVALEELAAAGLELIDSETVREYIDRRVRSPELLESLVDSPGPLARAGVGLGGASLAVEMFAWSDRHHGAPLAEAFHTPGREIQRRLATKEPTPEQLEVGIAALAEILRVEGA